MQQTRFIRLRRIYSPLACPDPFCALAREVKSVIYKATATLLSVTLFKATAD
jgi:hypothetical protein